VIARGVGRIYGRPWVRFVILVSRAVAQAGLFCARRGGRLVSSGFGERERVAVVKMRAAYGPARAYQLAWRVSRGGAL
jgi:hypothetical protein